MCEPTTVMAGASLAIGAASAMAKSSAENSAAGAANAGEANRVGAQNQQVVDQQAFEAQQALNAEAARNQEWNQQGIRQEQEIQAASGTMMDNAVRAKQFAAKAQAAGADAGVEGVSVESVARQVYREQGRLDASTSKNLDMTVNALQDEKAQSETKRLSRSSFAPIRAPLPAQTKVGSSLVDLGLGIGGAAVNAYSLYDRASSRGK